MFDSAQVRGILRCYDAFDRVEEDSLFANSFLFQYQSKFRWEYTSLFTWKNHVELTQTALPVGDFSSNFRPDLTLTAWHHQLPFFFSWDSSAYIKTVARGTFSLTLLAELFFPYPVAVIFNVYICIQAHEHDLNLCNGHRHNIPTRKCSGEHRRRSRSPCRNCRHTGDCVWTLTCQWSSNQKKQIHCRKRRDGTIFNGWSGLAASHSCGGPSFLGLLSISISSRSAN